MKTCITLLFPLFTAFGAAAQFAPQVGVSGSDAISSIDPAIKAWASKCTLYQGLQDITDPGLGYPGIGDHLSAIGPTDAGVVSLGDSGVAVLEFEAAIVNGPGPDLAVFENGFANPADKEEAFLELAFMEVSSDGVNFFRFPAVSNTPNTSQVKGSGDYMNARYVHNLAGKYIARNGTPFDLEELKGQEGLDVNNVTHVRIVDVIGDISGAHSSKDKSGNIINDPYPTPFSSSGFDLDAVAVLNSKSSSIPAIGSLAVNVYPNPAAGQLYIDGDNHSSYQATLTDISGRVVIRSTIAGNTLSLSDLMPGLYYLHIVNPEGKQWSGKISKI